MTIQNTASVAQIASEIGSTLLEDNERWTNRFQIQSQTSSSLYIIAQQRADGVWGCSCPGWRHHRRCKHVTDVLGRLTSLAERMPALNHHALMVSARTAFLILEPVVKTKKVKAAPGRVLDLD